MACASMPTVRISPLCVSLFVLCAFAAPTLARASEPQWVRISSTHFAVLTDAPEKNGRNVVLRFEQMRSVFSQLLNKPRINLPEPLEIIAFRNNVDYAKVRPARGQQSSGFVLLGEDRNYFVLDLTDDQSWQAVTHDFAHVFLDFNYPPTQPWFDEGFAEYFSSLSLSNNQGQVGGDTDGLTELLKTQPWKSLPELFSAQKPAGSESSRRNLFYAQSWIVMHYLINQNKLAATGAFFDMVENQKVPVAQAIQQAYGTSAEQFDKDIKAYFQSLNFSNSGQQSPGSTSPIHTLNVPSAGPEGLGVSAQQIPSDDAKALVAEMSLRVPEHRDQAVRDLEGLLTPAPKVPSAIPYRALAWASMERKDFPAATEELGNAMGIDSKDLWTRYYLALVKYNAAQTSGGEMQGLGNMMQDLRAVLDLYPEFAEGYYLLAIARLEGGGVNSALESIKAAIQLNPREQKYMLEMAQIYLAGKRWDAATTLLQHLSESRDTQVAQQARNSLDDVPSLKKYGRATRESAPQPGSAAAQPVTQLKKREDASSANENSENQSSENEEEHPQEQPREPQPDRRPVLFLKGRIVSVDCSQAPAAMVTVASGKRSLKLRTEDYKNLLLIGVNSFACDWSNRSVSVNYKAGGKADGDLVSLELQ
jgi:tetratricopeptide (TPR) repeat protein